MSDLTAQNVTLPPEQQAIRDKCFHPSGTFVEFPIEDIEQSIPARFEKIVRMYPDRVAVKMGSRALTYYELNQAANRIACAIVAKCGQRSEPVGILFANAIDVIAATLGALKSGKSYVAIDPSFTNERIGYMLDDSQAGLLVTNERNKELSQRLINHARALLDVDEIDDSRACDDLNLPISPDALASIVYTSGSTDSPKGVAHSHRSQLHTVMVNTNATRISFQDKLTLLHSIGFGSARANLFQSLLNGASLCLFDLKSESIHRLSKWLNEEHITIYHSTVGVFRQLAETMQEEEKYPYLRLIRLTGAPVNRLEFDLYKKKFAPGTLLQTVMNSTETNVICSFVTDGSFSFPNIGSPVGYPVAGKNVRLLDENGREVGLGQVGEIAIKSRYLASGYWRMPELTKATFLPDPNGSDERICLTGDLGTQLADGFLIHLGRKDFMVKVRGYRVELGEIERALVTHPQVKEAGVTSWESEVGERYLAGYVVRCEESALNASDLNKFLRKKLPEYVIPSTFMFLESLPLTNGKLNRIALPKPDRKRPDIEAPYVSPNSEVEQKLCLIWSDILAIDRVGIHDNFFDLGGHSLAATRVVSQVIKTFQLELPLQSLFQSPTVAEMAAVITEHQGKRLGNEELERMLAELEAMSENEAEQRLEETDTQGIKGRPA